MPECEDDQGLCSWSSRGCQVRGAGGARLQIELDTTNECHYIKVLACCEDEGVARRSSQPP